MIYSIIVLYRINGHINIFETIGVAIFPAFFIGYTAVVSPEYLNILQPNNTITDNKPEIGFINEITNLSKDKTRALFIFIPIYFILSYHLNKKLFHNVLHKLTG